MLIHTSSTTTRNTYLPARDTKRWAVDVVASISEFDSLEQAWGELLEEAEATPFQSFEWQRTWWKHFGESDTRSQLNIIAVRENERLVALAPFYIETLNRVGVIRLRRLTFIGRETTDYLDVITAKGYATECIPIIASFLATQSTLFDVVHLIDLPDRSKNHEILHQELQRMGFYGSHFVNEHCPRTTMQPSWCATLGALPAAKRSGLKRVQKKIESSFTPDLYVVNGSGHLREDFEEFIDLHQKRWNGSGQSGVFANVTTANFHREIARLFHEKHWLFLAFLRLDGKRVAANYGFIYRNQFFYYLSGIQIHGELAKYSLGKGLHLYSMAEVLKHGVKVYDFMRGTERYKYDFGGVDENNWTILMYPAGAIVAKHKFKIVLLVDSLRRRLAEERFLWNHISNGEEKAHRGLVAHIVQRIRKNIADGMQKVRAPEKSLTNGE
jgi:CelD/BcsL family acetyltransferase involved in cellulose biosynthesis